MSCTKVILFFLHFEAKFLFSGYGKSTTIKPSTLDFLHFKIKGDQKTLDEIKSKTKLDNNIVRFLTVKYKNLDLKTEYFSKNKS